MKAECVVDCRCVLGEGIIWDAESGVLWWVDIPLPKPRIHCWNPQTGEHRSWDMPEMVGSIAVRENGTLLVASHYGLNSFDPQTGALTRLSEPEKHLPQNRANDGKCDPQGRFWFGTMQNNVAPDGSDLPIDQNSGVLYRVESDLSVHPVVTDVAISNSLCWSTDERTLYFSDTVSGWIEAFDFEPQAGTVSNRRQFAYAEGQGYPDGATTDDAGGVWSCRWEGSCVIRFDASGEIDCVVEVPVERVTCAVFGGPNLDTLYITTSTQNMTPEEFEAEPQSGGIYAVQPGFRGVATPRFRE